MYIYIYIYIYMLYIYLYTYTRSHLPLQWLCVNLCTWAYDARLTHCA